MEFKPELKRKIKSPSDISLDELEMSTRLYQFLKSNNCKTLEDVAKLNTTTIDSLPGFNKKFIDEINSFINTKD